jgi:serine protease Do
MVTRVEPDSFADEIGMNERDIIVSINRQPVSSVEDIRRIQSTLKPGDAVAIRVFRSVGIGRTRAQYQGLFLAGTLPKD